MAEWAGLPIFRYVSKYYSLFLELMLNIIEIGDEDTKSE